MLRGERRDPAADVDDAPGGALSARISRSCGARREASSISSTIREAAAEITLQPLKRFPELDAAILFSDILIVPFAIGQNLTLRHRRGTAADAAACSSSALDQLTAYPARLDPIYETVRKVESGWPDDKTLIGFAGSPWTVATYMVAGQGSRDQAEARRIAYADPGAFGEIIERIEEVTLDYLSGQIEAGVEALQLFDSWAGSLSPAQFEQWVIAPTARLVADVEGATSRTFR